MRRIETARPGRALRVFGAARTRAASGREGFVKRNRTRGMTAVLLAFVLAVPAGLSAQGWIEPLPGRLDPGVVKARTSVSVRVTDRVAQVEVEEWFRNDGRAGLGEGDYLYPLPGEAVFSNFSLFQGDQELRGETMDAERARAIYEEIVRRKKDPALIELVGHGMVRARVYPINPGETRKITMRYTQVLKRAGDAVQFRYAAAGRFAGIAPAGRESAQGPQRQRERAPLTFALTVENGAQYRDAFSPTHPVRVTRASGRMVVRPEGSLEGDFALFLPFAERPVGLTLAAHRPDGENGYFMLTLSPGEAGASRVARDVTVVVDVSGSMSGEKIEQARRALVQLLGSLGRQDRFRLIRFSSGVSSWRSGWTAATEAEVRAARGWVDELRAEGGTNISGALEEAFRAESAEDRLPVIVFVTDGLPSAGERDPERIAELAARRAGRSRVFAFGVGYDVNTYLLDRLGVAGRGSTQYVEPGEDVEEALGVLAAKIRHPVLTDLEIAGSPVEFEEIYPRQLPDLFAGEELVVLGRYRAANREAAGALAIRGLRNGRTERYSTEARFPEHETENDWVARLWASRKLGVLQQEVRLNGANPELVEEIRQTALRYGLLSEYTSYLVQEPEIVASGGQRVQNRAQIAFAAAPPSAQAQVGAVSVVAAEQARASRDARSLADVQNAQLSLGERQKVALDQAAAGGVGGGRAQAVAGRVFAQQRDGGWADAAVDAKARRVTIEPFSDAYFALLRRLPELEPYWQAFETVDVAGRAVTIRLAKGGASRLVPAELDRLVSEFRAK
jgi:Ca-activated chloride channel family protein